MMTLHAGFLVTCSRVERHIALEILYRARQSLGAALVPRVYWGSYRHGAGQSLMLEISHLPKGIAQHCAGEVRDMLERSWIHSHQNSI